MHTKGGPADPSQGSTTSFLTATTLIYAIGAGITAAAGTELAGASSKGNVKRQDINLPVFLPIESALQPSGLLTHAVLLDQASAHCPIFPTAASRRSLGRVSVPVCRPFISHFHIFSVKKKFWIKSQILLFFLFFVSDLIFFIFLNFFF